MARETKTQEALGDQESQAKAAEPHASKTAGMNASKATKGKTAKSKAEKEKAVKTEEAVKAEETRQAEEAEEVVKVGEIKTTDQKELTAAPAKAKKAGRPASSIATKAVEAIKNTVLKGTLD